MDKLLSEFEAIKAEYALPNSMVDSGELYYFACKFAEVYADTMRENERLIALLEQRFKDGKRLGELETEDRLTKEIQHKHFDNL